MDKYFLAIIVLIIFSIIFVLYIRISARISQNSAFEQDPLHPQSKGGDDDSISYDSVGASNEADSLTSLNNFKNFKNLKSSDFTLLD